MSTIINSYTIQKFSDRELIVRLEEVRVKLSQFWDNGWRIYLHTPTGVSVSGTKESLLGQEIVQFMLDADAYSIKTFSIGGASVGNGHPFLRIVRGDASDLITTDGGFYNNFYSQHANVSKSYVILEAALKQVFNVGSINSLLSGDGSFTKFQKASVSIVSSLQNATEEIIVKAAKESQKRDEERRNLYIELEDKLRAELKESGAILKGEYELKLKAIEGREGALDKRQSEFNTKEAHYVAREKQDKQLEQVKGWLAGWSLTDGTSGKRKHVYFAYMTAIVCSLVLCISSIVVHWNLLSNQDAFLKLNWWQYSLLALKTVLPFAAFTTFIVYFIRWTDAWAAQHSQEEFRNRKLIIDIGRASWLLEAVRDAQVRDKELPEVLLKQLTNNMFEEVPVAEVKHNTMAHSLMDGLASVRIKQPDGFEVEAKKGKG